MRQGIEAVIHFILGERHQWFDGQVETIEPVELEKGEEGQWFIATDCLEARSVEAMLRKPASKPGLTLSLEKCRWQGTKSQRLREWLSRWIPFLSPWQSVTEVTIGAGETMPVKQELPVPALLVPRDCWRVFVKETGKEYAGGGLNVTVRVRGRATAELARG